VIASSRSLLLLLLLMAPPLQLLLLLLAILLLFLLLLLVPLLSQLGLLRSVRRRSYGQGVAAGSLHAPAADGWQQVVAEGALAWQLHCCCRGCSCCRYGDLEGCYITCCCCCCCCCCVGRPQVHLLLLLLLLSPVLLVWHGDLCLQWVLLPGGQQQLLLLCGRYQWRHWANWA
jgi:hypothetical protein